MSTKKCKIDLKCHVFYKEWTEKYFFIDTDPSKAVCLICNETCAIFKNMISKDANFGQQFLTQELKIRAADNS